MRKTLPDLLKGIAVILMIQVHLMELFARQDIYDGIYGRISLFFGGPPAAPVFMAVMGYFIAFGKKGMFQDVYRGVTLIIWGFLLNTGLNLHLFYHIYEGTVHINPLEYLFGVDILFLAGLSVLVIALIKPLFRDKLLPWLALAALMVVISNFLPASADSNTGFKYLLAYLGGHYHWSYFPLVPWLAYPLAGYAFALAETRIKAVMAGVKYLPVYMTGLVLVLVLTIGRASYITHHLESYYHHGILFFGWTVVFLACWSFWWNYRSNRFNENILFRYVCWTGRNVTSFYVFQWLIIGNLATQLYKTQGKAALMFWFIGIILATSLLVSGWRKIRDSRKKENLI